MISFELAGQIYNQLTHEEKNVNKDRKLECGEVVIIIGQNVYYLAQFCHINIDIYKLICLSSGNRMDDNAEFTVRPTIREIELRYNYIVTPIDVTLILLRLYNKSDRIVTNENNMERNISVFELERELEIVL